MDPLLSDGVGLAEVLIVLLKVVVAFGFLLVAVMLMIWFERKLISDMQNRIGPDLAGPWGLFQTFADGVKFFFKEDLKPLRAELGVFRLAPYLSIVPAFLTFAIVPVGGNFSGDEDGTVSIFGHETFLQVADPPIGILLFLALSSIAVYGVMLAGWSSGSKYPLLGSVRATAQMISYEAALGLSIAAVILVTGTLSTNGIVDAQAESAFTLGPLTFPSWNLWITGVVPFIVFLLAGTAELNRPPFDLVEAEQEIVGGFHTEYSSIRFALFFLAEFMNVITMSAIVVTLFLGGPAGPTPFGPDLMWGPIWFFAKVFVFLFMFVWFRATLPRFRYDQLMDLGWKGLIPIALGWLLVLAGVRIAQDEGWNRYAAAGIGIVALVLAWVLLERAIRAARAERLASGDTKVYD
jgi:NADH-quinone oxidoreductase subunit H